MKNNRVLKNYAFLLCAYLAFFGLLRLLFFLVFRDKAYPVSEVLQAFAVGARLDLSLSGLFAGVPFVALCALALWPRAQRAALAGGAWYFAALNTVFLLLAVSEFPFYREYSSRLNHLYFEYFSNPKELFVTIAGIPWVAPLAVLFLLLSYFCARYSAKGARYLLGGAEGSPLRRGLELALCAGLCVLFIRGGLQRRPVNWGAAFFSGEHFINQTALNGTFNLFKSYQTYLDERAQDLHEREYFTGERALALARETFGAPLARPDGLLRLKPGAPERPNFVLVFMESFSAEHIGALGSAEGLSPRFDALSRDGLLFTDFYSNGTRTSRAMVAGLASYPPLPGVNLTKKVAAQQKMPTTAYYLARRGYRSVFLYGGDRNFEDMGGFVRNNGFDRVYDKDDFRPWSRARNPIGVYDEELFEGADSVLCGLPQPFFAVIMTLTNHGPYILPDSYAESPGLQKELRTFKYSDYALGRFFELARKSPYFKNTIFVVMADHPIYYGEVGPRKFHIPLLFYSQLLERKGRDGRAASQMDLPPTFLRLAGDKTPQDELPFWGQPLDRRNPDVPVYYLEDPYFGVLGGGLFYREALNAGEARLFGPGGAREDDTARETLMRDQARSALQLSRELFFLGRAGRPWKR